MSRARFRSILVATLALFACSCGSPSADNGQLGEQGIYGFEFEHTNYGPVPTPGSTALVPGENTKLWIHHCVVETAPPTLFPSLCQRVPDRVVALTPRVLAIGVSIPDAYSEMVSYPIEALAQGSTVVEVYSGEDLIDSVTITVAR